MVRQRENNLAMVSKSLEQSESLQQNLKLALQALAAQQTDARWRCNGSMPPVTPASVKSNPSMCSASSWMPGAEPHP